MLHNAHQEDLEETRRYQDLDKRSNADCGDLERKGRNVHNQEPEGMQITSPENNLIGKEFLIQPQIST